VFSSNDDSVLDQDLEKLLPKMLPKMMASLSDRLDDRTVVWILEEMLKYVYKEVEPDKFVKCDLGIFGSRYGHMFHVVTRAVMHNYSDFLEESLPFVKKVQAIKKKTTK